MPELNEKEYLLIQGLARTRNSTQRELSELAGLSLGMTNLLLKRLVKKGFIKVKQLSWKKVQYILTVRGSMEKARKSASYAARNYQEFRRTGARIRANILEEYGRGLRTFTILTPPDIEELVRQAVGELELADAEFVIQTDPKKVESLSDTLFLAGPSPMTQNRNGRRTIDILESPASLARLEAN